MKLLEMNHVQKSFNNNTLHVLKDISLSVEKGEVIAIIGPSGSGKSTLLRCATLLNTMDGGDLRYDDVYAVKNDENGKSVYVDKNELKMVRKKFGLVFQNFNLFPHYSVLKNLVDPQTRVLGRSKEDAKRQHWNSWRRWVSRISRMPTPVSFPAGSNSVWPSRERWQCSRRSCSLMSRLLPLIRN